jgi:O-antigen/teichoic acid export membrane protein
MTFCSPPESLRKNSLWMIGGQLAALGSQAVYFVLIGRALGSREYGAFVGVAALIGALSQFSSLGMEMILVRDISRNRDAFARTWGHALLLATTGFLLLLAATITIAHFTLSPELRSLVPWIALADGLLGKFIQLSARAFQGAGQLAWTARLNALTTAARAAAAALVWLYARAHGLHLTALFWAHVYWIATLAVALFALALTTSQLGWPRFSRVGRADLSQGLSFSLSSSSISVYNDIDKTFLVSLGQNYAAGIYSAAYRIMDAASAPILAIHAAAAPRFFRQGMESVEAARSFAYHLLRRTLLYAVAISALLAIGAPIVPALFGPSFQGSIPVLRWLCLLPVLRSLHYAWGSAITASASQWNRTATQFAAAALNLCLNALLIPRWSWRGAAVASLLTDAALALLSYGVLAHLVRVEHRALYADRAQAAAN